MFPQTVEALISLVKERPELYNTTSEHYNNKMFVEQSWNQVADILQISVIEAKGKWNSLRSQYSRAVKFEKVTLPASGKMRKRWYMMDILSFLNDQVQPRSSTDNQISSRKNERDSKSIVGEIQCRNDMLHSLQEDIKIEPEDTTESEQLSKKMKIMSNNIVSINSPPSETDDHTDKQIENHDQLFFKSLDPDIKKLNNQRRRKFKEIVLQTLNQLLDEQENF